ncbi:hypothetical protein [Bacillus litorisediminis]|uniref:hypothetical protein n=1 Tax=Bacillus litorisediminis TaxID=2922713 RepID=UPI001FAF935F|nr:hypothetical protein [Bacillus litorisediminis]
MPNRSFFWARHGIAIMEALALKKLLMDQKHTNQKMIETFHQQAAKIISPIWNMVITEDFRYPDTVGKKPAGLSIQQWYAKNIFLLSSENKDIYNSFIKVMHLLRPTSSLMHPTIIKSVLKRTFTNNR